MTPPNTPTPQLERELAEARAEAARLREALQTVMDWSPQLSPWEADRYAERFRKDMDKARKVLEETK